MKYRILIIALCVAARVHSQSVEAPKAIDFKKLHWLEGTWTRTNNKPGRSGHERWAKVSDSEWRGWGVSMLGKDTAFVEKLKLVVRNNTIQYVADVPENKEPVYFKFTELSYNRFICENQEHDFPKKISYERTGNKLKAIISGNGKSVEYLFEKWTD